MSWFPLGNYVSHCVLALGLRQWRICLQCERPRFDPWVRKIPWRRKWQSTPVFLPREFHGQRNLVGYSPCGRKEWDRTQWLTLSLSSSISSDNYISWVGMQDHDWVGKRTMTVGTRGQLCICWFWWILFSFSLWLLNDALVFGSSLNVITFS